MKRLLLLLLSVTALTLNAQVYTEYFTVTDPKPDGTPGIALSPGDPIEVSDALVPGFYGWYLNPKSSNRVVGPDGQASPLVTNDDPLFYGDYKGSEQGQVVKIDSAVAYDVDQRSSNWAINNRAGDTLKLGAQGTAIYTAFLFVPQAQSKNSYRDFFGYEWSATTNSSRGRVFMNNQPGKVIFGVSRNKTAPVDGMDTISVYDALDQTFLMVMKYEAGDPAVDMDDTVRLYINPDPLKSEAEQTGIILVSKDAQSDKSEGEIVRLMIRQRGQNGLIGNIRVGTDWTEVLQGSAVTGVTLDKETLTIDAGSTGTLVATVSPDDARDASVSWSTSDSNIATVADGVVTGVAEGTATITATTTDGSFTANCEVTVNAVNGIFESSLDGAMIYPNPSNGEFAINNSEGSDIIVYNLVGKVMFRKSNIASNETINANLSKGMYLVCVTKDNNKRFAKLVIE